MRSVIAVVSLLMAAAAMRPAVAAECTNPNALGVSRVLVVDPKEHPLLGEFSYRESLPLNDHEVVLTFDDGPLPPYTNRILDILAHECVKATFFMVGRMARGYPHMVKRVFEEGHTVASHSQSHPFTFHKMSVEHAAQEIEGGFASIKAALGNPDGVAPFFRFPGLLHQAPVERYLIDHGYQAWSVDLVADDWTHINNREIVRRAITRLEARRKGILLLHDIQPATALGLADLLAELKAHHFKIVQVVPATAERPKTPTTPDQWLIHRRHEPQSIWPEPAVVGLATPASPKLATPSPQSFGVSDTPGALAPAAFGAAVESDRGQDGSIPLPPVALWPRTVAVAGLPDNEVLPAPAPETFRYSRVWVPNMSTRATRRLASHKSTAHRTAARQATPDDVTNSISASTKRSPAATGETAATHRAPKRQRTARARTNQAGSGHQIELPRNSNAAPARRPSGGLFDLFR